MSRSSGTYTAPSSSWNPAVEGTTVDESDWNTLLDDIETALTESVYTSGMGATDNRLVRTDGTDTKKVQGTGIAVDDSNNVSGVGTFDTTGTINVTAAAAYLQASGSSSAAVQLYATGGGSDEKYLEWYNTGATAVLRMLTDAYASPVNFAVLTRSGTTPVSIDLAAAAQTFSGITTTASAANAFLDSGASNSLLRSTSSGAYKRDVEPLSWEAAQNILKLQPVWYRSKAAADNPAWSWYGLIAEDVAKIDPRLVHWGYQDDDFETVTQEKEAVGPNGKPVVTSVPVRQLKPGAQKKPDGVQYERLTLLLLEVVKKLCTEQSGVPLQPVTYDISPEVSTAMNAMADRVERLEKLIESLVVEATRE